MDRRLDDPDHDRRPGAVRRRPVRRVRCDLDARELHDVQCVEVPLARLQLVPPEQVAFTELQLPQHGGPAEIVRAGHRDRVDHDLRSGQRRERHIDPVRDRVRRVLPQHDGVRVAPGLEPGENRVAGGREIAQVEALARPQRQTPSQPCRVQHARDAVELQRPHDDRLAALDHERDRDVSVARLFDLGLDLRTEEAGLAEEEGEPRRVIAQHVQVEKLLAPAQPERTDRQAEDAALAGLGPHELL